MDKIPVSNTTDCPIWVGASMVAPGETRHFYPHEVPPEFRPAEAPVEEPAADTDPLADLLELSIKAIKAQFGTLTFEQLEKLGELEQLKETPRSSLLSEIGNELLTRSSRAEITAKIKSLPALSDDELSTLVEDEKAKGNNADNELAAALVAEVETRKTAAQ
ncbi:hypothetical protein LG200_05070 [Methylobacillus caricis]|uniref:hypothetical protein n=1 Tax=Methylobacillus caricis TaxID=1971611 RepID=UPI001CFFFB39|nr:hypothetical protein [Methylobacillus caricis]MCB5187375.1 hypothetical protein [Methylobacillus caricis]